MILVGVDAINLGFYNLKKYRNNNTKECEIDLFEKKKMCNNLSNNEKQENIY